MKKIALISTIILSFTLTACGDPEKSPDPYTQNYNQSKKLKQQIDQLPNSEERVCKINPEAC